MVLRPSPIVEGPVAKRTCPCPLLPRRLECPGREALRRGGLRGGHL